MKSRLLSIAALAALALTAPAASAATLPGNPLTVHVGDRGQLQAFRAGDPTGIFFAPMSENGDTGFFLAFPDAATPAPLANKVYGFTGSAGPDGLVDYTPVSQSAPPAAAPRAIR